MVHAGGPAQRAGLRPRDVITHVDGLPTEKAAPPSLLALRSQAAPDGLSLLARPGTVEPPQAPDKVRITYRRPGGEARTVELCRERHRPEAVQGVRRLDDNRWDYLLDAKAKVAHVRLLSLCRGASDELREVLTQLRDLKVRGLILDLRWCPGGYLNEAVEAAELFLGEAIVATVKSRGKDTPPFRSTAEGGKFRDVPMVVLVNAETSGGAELIAAALQDHKRARVVGQRTLGKASVQTPITVGLDGIGFKLTSGTFMRPGGGNLHRFPEDSTSAVWGVLPDVDARLSQELGRRLKEQWQAFSLRPAGATERLALDDPQADPQQRAAPGRCCGPKRSNTLVALHLVSVANYPFNRERLASAGENPTAWPGSTAFDPSGSPVVRRTVGNPIAGKTQATEN